MCYTVCSKTNISLGEGIYIIETFFDCFSNQYVEERCLHFKTRPSWLKAMREMKL